MKLQNISTTIPFIATWLLVVLASSSSISTVDAAEICVDRTIDGSQWTTSDEDGIWDGKTCNDIAEMPLFWCDYLEDYSSKATDTTPAMSSTTACCVCSKDGIDGGEMITLDELAPSASPSDSPTQCKDEEDFYWNEDASNPLRCDKVTEGFCDDLSKVWREEGKNVMSACCACGGGQHVPIPGSDEPSSNPSSEPSLLPTENPTDVPSSIPSVTPTTALSSTPSSSTFEKCTDIEDWTTYDGNGFWSSHTCDDIAELPEFWCVHLAPYTNPSFNDMGTGEACCACGGGIKTQDIRSKQPSEAPSDAPTRCEDQPFWYWNADKEYGCERVTPGFCDTLSPIWYQGKNVELACCSCGGGKHVPYVPSTVPSAEPSISVEPSDEPSFAPTVKPSSSPSDEPSLEPTSSSAPTKSAEPSTKPSSEPSSRPSAVPSAIPSTAPSSKPSGKPSLQPSSIPSTAPSDLPSFKPSLSLSPSSRPSSKPSSIPSFKPTSKPSSVPTFVPSSTPTLQCFDYPLGWYDEEGEKFNCEWYADKKNCEFYGSLYANPTFGNATADAACCVCGGGVTNGSPSEIPSSSPTNSASPTTSMAPSSKPTGPVSGIGKTLHLRDYLHEKGTVLVGNGKYVGGFNHNDYVTYKDVDFGPSGTVKSIKMRYATLGGGKIDIKIDDTDGVGGQLIASHQTFSTDSRYSFVTTYVLLDTDVGGKHNLTFVGNNEYGRRIADIDWFELTDVDQQYLPQIFGSDYDEQYGTGTYQGAIDMRDYDYIKFNNVNFGPSGTTKSFKMYARGDQGFKVKFKLGSYSGTVIGEFDSAIREWLEYETVSIPMIGNVGGIQDLVIMTEMYAGNHNSKIHFLYFQLSDDETVFERIPAVDYTSKSEGASLVNNLYIDDFGHDEFVKYSNFNFGPESSTKSLKVRMSKASAQNPKFQSFLNYITLSEDAVTAMGGKQFLLSDSLFGSVIIVPEETNDGFQQWTLRLIEEKTYHIVSSNISGEEKFLSVSASGTSFSTVSEDDGSGLQRWQITEVPSTRFPRLYHIRVAGGTNDANKVYLSFDGTSIGLSSDGETNYAHWNINPIYLSGKLEVHLGDEYGTIIGELYPEQTSYQWTDYYTAHIPIDNTISGVHDLTLVAKYQHRVAKLHWLEMSFDDMYNTLVPLGVSHPAIRVQHGPKIKNTGLYSAGAGGEIALSSDGKTVVVGTGWISHVAQYKWISVYKFNDETKLWQQFGPDIQGSDYLIGNHDYFGRSVDISGDGLWVVIGTDTRPGEVVVVAYDDVSSSWIQIGQTLKENNSFGGDVSISRSGDGAVLSVASPDNIKVYTYVQASNTWTQAGSSIATSHGYCTSVATSGTRISVGDLGFRSANDLRIGAVSVYDFDGSDWHQVFRVVGEDDQDFVGYGACSLSGDGTTVTSVALGRTHQPENQRQAHIRIFRNDDPINANTTWTNLGGDLYGPAKTEGRFHNDFGRKSAISFDGRVVAFSGQDFENTGRPSGWVRMYELNDKDEWVQVAVDQRGLLDNWYTSSEKDDHYGTGLGLSADGKILGVSTYDSRNVYMYQNVADAALLSN